MPQVGVLTTGAGVTSVFSGQASCGALLVLGDVDTANAIQGLQVEIDGQTYVNIQNNAALCNAYSKWQMETAGAGVIGLAYKLATGKIDKNTTYRITNNGATTPAVRVLSDNQNGIPFVAATKGIVASSSETFQNFSCLMIDIPANVGSIEIAFKNGHTETWTVQDADAYFALDNQSETDGRLGGVTVIDNTEGEIEQVRINATTAITVLVVKLPDNAHAALRENF